MLFKKKDLDERTKSGLRHDWSKIPRPVNELTSVGPKATTVSFHRIKNSHEGLRDFDNIRRLFAYNVDDDFLKEIACLSGLTYLWAEIVTAQDMTPLTRLGSLEFLILRSVRKAKSFSFVAYMPQLRHLGLEWVKHLNHLDDFRQKKNLLSFGIEGATPASMTQKIDSLAPILEWPELHSLYLTNTKVLDGNLRCLAQIASLHYLETARFYPKSEFDALKAAHPKLKCQWFDQWEIAIP